MFLKLFRVCLFVYKFTVNLFQDKTVTDFLKFTHRITKVKINGNWHLAEITKPIQSQLEKSNLDITLKICGIKN
ncbi:MAG: hypothetical protein COS14_10415 [Bacteroidetes bacterium CG02_land_8_20_14_3_00_31_25]|nr:MAG: hypothetical protein COS14_10415 [Bacteroidetes bacterium CG02_land_8_20_14_3_00_31_25]PIX32348.1 MAG: hypothetical protein COZ59_14475 [Bacteroidetes bacterium CG_4_8_14_3_um_filter_31_14]PIY02673.1 MAG: hypothetical protein COZ21_12955 [Bacteroidetes bacterium CG_4_10_14_3_um_filter_31_20]